MGRISTALILTCLVVCSAAHTKQIAANYRYDTPGTCLEGTLIERKVYGPPGYGETPARDAKDTIFILKLFRPVTVEPAPNAEAQGSANLDTFKNVQEMQLLVERPRRAAARNLVGKTVLRLEP